MKPWPAPAVTVYTTDFCGYCLRVKSLLERQGIAYTEVNVADHPGLREKLLEMSGRRTLPQVYVGERFVGGADEIIGAPPARRTFETDTRSEE